MRPLSLAILLVGCGGPQAETDPTAPTWNADVLQVMEEHCTSCHTDGGVAPMALDTYESLEADSPSAKQPVHLVMMPYIDSLIMPPSGGMSECIDYMGAHSDTIDEVERDILVRWLEADRPRGEGPEVHYQAPASPADALGEPDHIVRRKTAYQPSFGGDGGDYACFMIESGFTETTYISSIVPAIDNQRIVHHMLLFRAEDNGSEWCRGEEMTSDLIAGWAPGQDGWFLPEGVAFRMDPGEVFALQIHYDDGNDNDKDDRSGMALYFSDTVPEHEAGVLWTGAVFAEPGEPSGGIGEFMIPAGEADHTVKGSCTILDAMGEISIFGAWPHMHLLGSHMQATADIFGADQCLVDVPFSFDDQRGYQYTTPVVMKPGDRIDTTCVFDNSAANPDNPYDPPRDIYLGEGTADEMCLNFLMYWPAADVQYCLF